MPAIPPRLTALAERSLPAPLVRQARIRYWDWRRRRHPRRVVEHTYAGVRHRVLIDTEYAERYDMEYPELAEIAWLKERRLRAGARVFDLGASVGVIAIMLADAVGPDGQVVALEAHPGDAASLQRNKELNGLLQLECLHAAVARESGTVPFGRHGSVDDGSARWGADQVPAYSIDDLARRYGAPDVVFIDVEGYELEALRGAEQTLAAGPDWFVEVHYPEQLARYGASSLEVLDCLERAGYVVSTLMDSGYQVAPDGTRHAIAAPIPLAETPPELLRWRFFALATRGQR